MDQSSAGMHGGLVACELTVAEHVDMPQRNVVCTESQAKRKTNREADVSETNHLERERERRRNTINT